MPHTMPRREDYADTRSWQDANVAYCAKNQIAYCEARQREREAEDEWTVQPEGSSDGLEDLL